MPKQTFFNLPDDKRERIIQLALEEFATYPYNKASLSNIVVRAGIAKGSMYQYFEDKKDLYNYLWELAGNEKLAYIQREVNAEADFFTMLEQMIVAGIKFSLDHPQLSQVVANAMEPSAQEIFQELQITSKRRAMTYFEQMVAQAQDRGEVRRDVTPRLIAVLLVDLLGTGLTDYLMDSLSVSIKEFLSNPKLAESLTGEKIRQIVAHIMLLLRGGMEGGQNHGDGA